MASPLNDQIQLGQDNQNIQSSENYLVDLQKSARLNFIKKVYTILTLQLAVTVGFCTLAYNIQSFLQFQMNNTALLWISIAAVIAVQIAIICTPLGKKFPTNMLLLLAFTLCKSYSVSFICSAVAKQQGGQIVLIAAAMTLGIFIVLSIYACTTKTDFVVKNGILLTVISALFMFMVLRILSPFPFWNSLYCTFGVIIFGIYVIMDTQIIIGSHKYGISMDDYIVGALILYIDIIQLFLYILRLLSESRR